MIMSTVKGMWTFSLNQVISNGKGAHPFRHRNLYWHFGDTCSNCHQNNYATTSSASATKTEPAEDSTVFNTEPAVPVKKTRKKKNAMTSEPSNLTSLSKISKDIQKVVNRQGRLDEVLSSLIPRQYLKQIKTPPKSLYLIDKDVASEFANLIEPEINDRSCPVVELHPGIGLLTSELVNRIGFKHVTCFQDNLKLQEYLTSQHKVKVIATPTDSLPRLHHLDKHDGGERINSILNQIKTESTGNVESSPQKHERLYLIGTVPQLGLINFLIRSYATHRLFFDEDLPWSKVTMFLALGPKPYHVCNATPQTGMVTYRPTSVFFQTLFKSKELGTLPRKAFIPFQLEEVSSSSSGERKKRIRMHLPDPSIFKVFKIDINEDALAKIGKENLFTYWYFVRHHLHARSTRIIPELENWIPGCGIGLIKQGFNIYSQFGSLQPDEILNMYLQFVSWPEFTNSSFLSAMEKYQARLELTEEDDGERNISFESKRG